VQVRTWCHSGTLFAPTSFSAIHEAFSSSYPDREIPNETAVHRLVTTFGPQKVFGCDKCLSVDKVAEIMTVYISGSASAATTVYGCKN
jgi:hypothetical protein